MSKNITITPLVHEDHRTRIFKMAGDLDFSNVMAAYEQTLPLFDSSSDLQIDCSEIKAGNSAMIALILEWVKRAREKNIKLQLLHLPEKLLLIAKSANVDTLLSL